MSNPTCSFTTCTAPARSKATDAICDNHYMAKRRALQDNKPWPTDKHGLYDYELCPAHCHDIERVDDLLDRVTLVENSISAHYRISLDKGGGDVVKVEGLNHRVMPYVIELLAAGVMPYIVGPAGSGKTTMDENCAAALGLDFYSTGAFIRPTNSAACFFSMN